MDLKIKHLQKFRYDTQKYEFKELLEKLYCIENIAELHKYVPEMNQSKLANDSSSIFHKIFYGTYEGSDIQRAYIQFLENEIKENVGEEFYYQQIPCIRIGMPQQKWLDKFHKDSDFNHPKQEINFNIAITKSEGTAGLQIEETPKNGNYIALEQEYGEYTRIDHINCRHGSIANIEQYTFASLDFRIVLKSDSYEAFGNEGGSILLNKKFKPGFYFSNEGIK